MEAEAAQPEYAQLEHLETLTEEQRVQLCYQAGDLSYKLWELQEPDYQLFREWNERRQTREYRRWVIDIGASFDNLWLDEEGRKCGKTAKWILIDVEECLRRPNCRGLLGTAFQKSIGTIVVPLVNILFRDAPPGFRPEYKGTNRITGDHECLYIPATNSSIRLVGLDMHADALRGPYLDFCHITEGAFVKGEGLESLVRSEIMPQFQGRPHAWIAIESSTAKVPDHDFNTVFREDARQRGCYTRHVITDNTRLTPEDIETEIVRAGGRQHRICKRELFCEQDRDDESTVVPEFDAPSEDRPHTAHVVDPVDWEMPRNALAWTCLDPGLKDPLGLVWFYFHWPRQCIVVQAAFAKSNMSIRDAAAKIREIETLLWGTEHPEPPAKLDAERPRRPEPMSIRDALENRAGQVWTPPEAALTYWDDESWTYKPNPYARISDIDAYFLNELELEQGIGCRKAQKGPGSATAHTEYMRDLFAARPVKIVILDNGLTLPLIMQLRSGMWNTDERGHRTDWMRSKTLGHLDCVAGLGYGLKDVNFKRRPSAPNEVVDPRAADWVHPEDFKKRALGQSQSEAFGGRGGRTTFGTGRTGFR